MSEMKTVHEVSKLTGISTRTLQYYDTIGLFQPAEYTEAGYRLYDDESLSRLQMILLFRELEFPLKDIKGILDNPDFDRNKALEQQIKLLEMRKEHIENLILLARGMKLMGVKYIEDRSKADFTAFDTTKIDEYVKQAKESWRNTPQWKEYEEKAKSHSEDFSAVAEEMMQGIFAAFGKIKDKKPESKQAQALVKKLQEYITENFYTCTNDVLRTLAKLYAGGGEFTANIDAAGGEGTAEFAAKAIEIYCK